MTIKRKLTEVGEVTPTINDSAVINQLGTVKESKLSLIYDLFKTGYDAIYATTASLSSYVTTSSLITTLTDYVTNSALATALSNYTTTVGLTALLSGKRNNYVDNQQTAASTVTINAKTGTATFTAVINVGATNQFTVNSTSIGPLSRISWSVYYDVAGGGLGLPQPVLYNTTGSGVVFYVKNIGASNTNQSIQITFDVLN